MRSHPDDVNTTSRVVGFTSTRFNVNAPSSPAPISSPRDRRLSGLITDITDGWFALAAALYGTGLRPADWHEEAACTGAPADFDGSSRTRADRAKALCDSCPVKAACAADQLQWERERTGRTYRDSVATVRGGLSATDRYYLHRPTTQTPSTTVREGI
jgi:transcription factor WhiB